MEFSKEMFLKVIIRPWWIPLSCHSTHPKQILQMCSKEEFQIQPIYSFPPSHEASTWWLLIQEVVVFKTLLVLVLNYLLILTVHPFTSLLYPGHPELATSEMSWGNGDRPALAGLGLAVNPALSLCLWPWVLLSFHMPLFFHLKQERDTYLFPRSSFVL